MAKKIDVYRNISYILKHSEKFDRKKEIINGLNIYQIGQDRFNLTCDVTRNLLHKLSMDVRVKAISFFSGLQDDVIMNIELENNKNILLSYSFIDNHYEFLNNIPDNYCNLINSNKKSVLECFKDGINYELFDEENFSSTTKVYNAKIKNNECKIYIDSASFPREYLECIYNYKTKSDIIDYSKININTNVKKLDMMTYEQTQKILENIKFYRDDIRRLLVKHK